MNLSIHPYQGFEIEKPPPTFIDFISSRPIPSSISIYNYTFFRALTSLASLDFQEKFEVELSLMLLLLILEMK